MGAGIVLDGGDGHTITGQYGVRVQGSDVIVRNLVVTTSVGGVFATGNNVLIQGVDASWSGASRSGEAFHLFGTGNVIEGSAARNRTYGAWFDGDSSLNILRDNDFATILWKQGDFVCLLVSDMVSPTDVETFKDYFVRVRSATEPSPAS